MRLRTSTTILAALLIGAFAGILPAGAETAGDAPFAVELLVGETFEVCKSGQILCPAISPICDDLKVIVPVDTPDGLGFKGAGPGTTLCSAASATGQRRVFRFTVR
ncbi:MAG: hypothetical protein FIA93_07925 [Deltaproteobacteria bacterium]|nr:hypothetical protein [Deltaproteobacteria bacterium]PWB67753.1 MAG: hypothetical protein C3F14_01285 [Deltaproteobacteria bacterium]